jgi:DNA processing protein
LIRTEGVGPRLFQTLINRYGGAGHALEALPLLAANSKRAMKICSVAQAEQEMAQIMREGAQLVALGETFYPSLLAEIDAPPPLLTVRGRISLLRERALAIVGSRNASAAGLKMAERLSLDLGRSGFVIVSGLARGIDGRAHTAALPRGTIAIMAGGINKIYPPEHAALYAQLAEEGLLVTEMPFDWEPRGRDFPRRNRIISGLCRGVVVVEAAERSGSLITARFALEQGREVFAVPGSPLDPRAGGTNHLLRNGATFITEAAHIEEALRNFMGEDAWQPAQHKITEHDGPHDDPLWDEYDFLRGDISVNEEVSAPSVIRETPETPYRGGEPERTVMSPQTDIQAILLSLLGPVPMAIDDVIHLSGFATHIVAQNLTELEFAGLVVRHSGHRISLSSLSDR